MRNFKYIYTCKFESLLNLRRNLAILKFKFDFDIKKNFYVSYF